MFCSFFFFFFFSSTRRHTRYWRDWSSDVCSSDLAAGYSFLDTGAQRRTRGPRRHDRRCPGHPGTLITSVRQMTEVGAQTEEFRVCADDVVEERLHQRIGRGLTELLLEHLEQRRRRGHFSQASPRSNDGIRGAGTTVRQYVPDGAQGEIAGVEGGIHFRDGCSQRRIASRFHMIRGECDERRSCL